MFAQTFRAVGPMGISHLQDQRLDRGNVADGRHQIVMQVLGPPGDIFLHQRHSKPLGDATLYLPLDQQRVDRAAHIMGGDKAQRAAKAKGDIHLDHHQMRGIAELRIGHALPVFIQRFDWRIIAFLRLQHIALRIDRQPRQIKALRAPAVGHRELPVLAADLRGGARIDLPQDLRPQRFARLQRGVARHKGLPRGRGFARVRRDVGVTP